jgi:hypothetical protein
MTLQVIQIGEYANDGTGDDLRTAFQKVNDNFTSLGGTVSIANAVNIGTGVGVFAQRNLVNLEFKKLTSSDNSIMFDSTIPNSINMKAAAVLNSDPAPQLSANLFLNGHNIIGTNGTGDVQSTVFGLDIRILNALLELAVAGGGITLDFGSFTTPTTGQSLDMGTFGAPPSNNLNFGTF